MAHAESTEGATECVESVKFGLLSAEEVKKISLVKITNTSLLDTVGNAVEGGLYDPRMGPTEEKNTICRSCDQRSLNCPGHCGHIDLVVPVYNPLLFRNLVNLLQKVCFYCHKFRDSRERVKLCTSQLELILKGDIVGAKSMNMHSKSKSKKNRAVNADGVTDHAEVHGCYTKHSEQHKWTSQQFKEAMLVLDGFMKKKQKKCEQCLAKNPTITSQIFGWIETNLSSTFARGNVITGTELEQPFSSEVEHGGKVVDSDDAESSGAVYDATPDFATIGQNRDSNPYEAYKQQSLSGPFLPSEVKRHMELLWQKQSRLCSIICDIQQERLCMTKSNRGFSMFFIDSLLVPPTKFRAPNKVGDSVSAHPHTTLLIKILEANIAFGNAHKKKDQSTVDAWRKLQQSVNLLFGNKKTTGKQDNQLVGICQLLEKKEGIFRQKMMGKRVNFACRSVISPDPYLAVNEIGIPPYFALRLSYPERVTPWNADKLRNAILNGDSVHPGATHYTDKVAKQKLPGTRKERVSISRKLSSSIGSITQIGKTLGHEQEGMTVYRHLQDGDIVLVNRQPTLHKASIMAHVVRVLKGEKTLRMHYANCSSYNADFDGDEMNVHFPQDEISRAEAFNIVNANNQYIIPTSGDTRRGLIQDHIVSAVLLTKKDTFLTRDEYNHLIYSSGVSSAARGTYIGKSGQKVSIVNSEDEILPILPAILKPEPLWTGKQIITSLLNHMTRTNSLPPLTVEKRASIPSKYFGESNEGYLLVRKNEFVDGVLDKAQFGKYGLVHSVQEFYGSDAAGSLLSGLSRLFTVFLQMHGFTCGVDDLLLEEKVDNKRRTLLEDAKNIGEAVYFDFVHGKDGKKNKDRGDMNNDVENKAADNEDRQIDPVKLQRDVERTVRVNGESAISVLDKKMASAINKLTSEVNNKVISLPKGLLKPFPQNCFILMTVSGAKGGQVNFSQISSLLGQQSLEGKRVPLMISGKTLPCFPPWESAPRAGGFISDCFLTGLRPQEYYFHCMAGREGLVDTAVKTSRSGYLQRCLIKNLESLKVGYDHTVRDADGSVIQFCYGEDGVDVHKTSFMTEFDKLASNQRAVLQRLGARDEDDQFLKSDSFVNALPEALKKSAKKFISGLSKKQRSSLHVEKRKDFMNLVKLKYHSSLAQPGEPVGVIAAQSVGEPSTQMTLNTFHHAGQKESNVTLGIPRLQEILTRASENMRTPVMYCPLLEGKTKEDAQRLAESLRRVSVADIVENIEISVVPFSVQNNQVSTIYKLKMKIFPPEFYPPFSNITLEDCEVTLRVFFVEELEKAIQAHSKMLDKIKGINFIEQKKESGATGEEGETDTGSKSKKAGEENDDDDDDADDENGEDLDRDTQKRKQQATDEMDYEDVMDNGVAVVKNKSNVEDSSVGFESEVDKDGGEDDISTDGIDDDQITDGVENDSSTYGEIQITDREEESRPESPSTSKPSKNGKKSEASRKASARKVKDSDKTVYVACDGLDFEVHLRLSEGQHILLSQIAHKAAKNVYIRRSGNIDECTVEDVKAVVEKGSLVEQEYQGLRTAGVNFRAFWDMEEELDVRKIYTNDIHSMLRTYGIEAARATFIKEVKAVFEVHGASVDIRHLSLIADFMTHSGDYRPMSRHGMAASTSPLSKMSFETASNFIMEAAYHGLVDDLESPSARICLGLPVKMGTGSFDLMHKVEF